MSSDLITIFFWACAVGFVFIGFDLWRMHSIGPRVWKELHQPWMSDKEFDNRLRFRWVVVVICGTGTTVTAAMHIICFWKL